MRMLSIIVLSALLLLNGCNAVNDVKGVVERQKVITNNIKEKTGLDARVGWEINNGELTRVTVIFDAGQVRDKTVSYLESAVQDTLSTFFETTPQEVNLKIICNRKK